jgi:hypothetical protein
MVWRSTLKAPPSPLEDDENENISMFSDIILTKVTPTLSMIVVSWNAQILIVGSS